MGFGDDLENSPPPPAGRSARPKRAKSDDDAADENDDAAADTGPSANEKCADELQEFAKKTAEMRKKLKTYGSKRDDKAFRDRAQPTLAVPAPHAHTHVYAHVSKRNDKGLPRTVRSRK